MEEVTWFNLLKWTSCILWPCIVVTVFVIVSVTLKCDGFILHTCSKMSSCPFCSVCVVYYRGGWKPFARRHPVVLNVCQKKQVFTASCRLLWKGFFFSFSFSWHFCLWCQLFLQMVWILYQIMPRRKFFSLKFLYKHMVKQLIFIL